MEEAGEGNGKSEEEEEEEDNDDGKAARLKEWRKTAVVRS